MMEAYLVEKYTEIRTIYGCIALAAAEKPDERAVTVAAKDGKETALTWSELVADVDRAALHLKGLGLGVQSRVVIAVPNSLAAVVMPLAAWHLGCCVFFLSYEMPERERSELLRQIEPDLLISTWTGHEVPSVSITDELLRGLPLPDAPLPDISSSPSKAVATGGSSGTPKIIIEDAAMEYGINDFFAWYSLTGQNFGHNQLICGSLHHSLFSNPLYISLAMGNSVIVLQRFDEEHMLKCIEKYRVNCLMLVPVMMGRILRSPSLKATDLSSIVSMNHAGASCPAWLKKAWIELLGGERVFEFYAMSEKIGTTFIRGDEWLAHEGSVGRPFGCEVSILDDEGAPVSTGVVGNVFFTAPAMRKARYFHESQKLTRVGDALSVGDLGYLDEDGYLYLVDRRSDMIISGGKNIYAAEVENALREHRQIADILVIGLPDAAWGRRVHAIIEPACPAEEFDLYAFTSFGFRKISNYKLPKTIELIERIPRDNSGKVNKSRLTQERVDAGEDSEAFGYITVPNGHQLNAWRAAKKKREAQV